MRFQIDEHREELKKRIDEFALEMIYLTKKYQANIFVDAKRASFFETSSFDETKSLLTSELIAIEETFCGHLYLEK